MQDSVIFRNFEERDVDFIYKCKNDEKLNSMIVGEFKPFSYEDAINWVHGCMERHDSFKFWAICTNDDEKKIVGWTSISQIDSANKSACLHGIVIGDNEYRDGIVALETLLFCLNYVFNVLGCNRSYGICLADHPVSPPLLYSLGFILEGTKRQGVYKYEKYHDVLEFAMLKTEYESLYQSGELKINKLIRKFIKNIKQNSVIESGK